MKNKKTFNFEKKIEIRLFEEVLIKGIDFYKLKLKILSFDKPLIKGSIKYFFDEELLKGEFNFSETKITIGHPIDDYDVKEKEACFIQVAGFVERCYESKNDKSLYVYAYIKKSSLLAFIDDKKYTEDEYSIASKAGDFLKRLENKEPVGVSVGISAYQEPSDSDDIILVKSIFDFDHIALYYPEQVAGYEAGTETVGFNNLKKQEEKNMPDTVEKKDTLQVMTDQFNKSQEEKNQYKQKLNESLEQNKLLKDKIDEHEKQRFDNNVKKLTDANIPENLVKELASSKQDIIDYLCSDKTTDAQFASVKENSNSF